MGSDRLKKAIERNRAKQVRRSAASKTKPSAKADDSWSLPRPSSSMAPKRRTRRSVAATHENVEFTTALRKSKSSPAPVDYSPASSTSSKVSVLRRSSSAPAVRTTPTKRKVQSKTRKKIMKGTNEAITRGIWVFCAFLLLRLVFSDGGVEDFYAKREVLQDHFTRLSQIETENRSLLLEIEKLDSDPQYQKKVVRDHLGYIARDEYLVLFPSKS
jgi:cell division protein FtsB